MTENKRIVLNAMATYGRSLFGLFVGLFCARWLLQALGETDFGLFNAVGGIMPFVSVLNGIVYASVARYYAFVIGQGKNLPEEEAAENLRKWFSTAFFLHTVIPLALVVIGYPIGMYAVHHWFVIPPERVVACEWLIRCAFVSTFITMAAAPFTAMYSAKQLITELAFFGMLQTILYAISAYVLLHANGDRLILYSFMMGGYLSINSLAQTCRAFCAFKACRAKWAYMVDWKRIKKLLTFSGWTFFSTFGMLVKNQGLAFLINANFAPSTNAAYTIANQVSNQANSLSTALQQALVPAVTTAEGASNHQRALILADKSCKFVTLVALIFCVPLIAEIKTVLTLWLGKPPLYTAEFCIFAVLAFLINRVSEGYAMAIMADGRIARLQTLSGFLYLASILIGYGFIKAGYGPLSIGYAILAIYALMTLVRLVLSHVILEISIWEWVRRIAGPAVLVFALSLGVAIGCTSVFPSSVLRVLLTGVVSAVASLGFSWLFAFDADEKKYLLNFAKRRFRR